MIRTGHPESIAAVSSVAKSIRDDRGIGISNSGSGTMGSCVYSTYGFGLSYSPSSSLEATNSEMVEVSFLNAQTGPSPNG
jgi:hypothetical protein